MRLRAICQWVDGVTNSTFVMEYSTKVLYKDASGSSGGSASPLGDGSTRSSELPEFLFFGYLSRRLIAQATPNARAAMGPQSKSSINSSSLFMTCN